MNCILYNNIINSIEVEIKNIIKEQFNIGNMNFNGNGQKHKPNIFNKNGVNPYDIYDKIINNEHVSDDEIEYINDMVSKMVPDNIDRLKDVIYFYSNNYPYKSLNWLDVSVFTDMDGLFYNTRYNGDISKWNVSNVQNMQDMFMCSHFNGDISGWDVSNVTDMSYMFRESRFNGDISGWNVSNVKNMQGMFMKSKFNGDISQWDVSNVTNMQSMFNNNSKFNHDISCWNTVSVKRYYNMFFKSVIKEKYKPNI